MCYEQSKSKNLPTWSLGCQRGLLRRDRGDKSEDIGASNLAFHLRSRDGALFSFWADMGTKIEHFYKLVKKLSVFLVRPPGI